MLEGGKAGYFFFRNKEEAKEKRKEEKKNKNNFPSWCTHLYTLPTFTWRVCVCECVLCACARFSWDSAGTARWIRREVEKWGCRGMEESRWKGIERKEENVWWLGGGGRKATCGDSASKKLYSSRVRCLFLFCPPIHVYFVHPLDARFIQHLFCFVFFVFRAPSSLSLDSIQTAFPLIFHRFSPLFFFFHHQFLLLYY